MAAAPGAADAAAMLVGLGRSHRVLVAQAVLDSHTDEEVEVIVAHELAHHRQRDVWWSGAAVVATLALGFYASARLLERCPRAWGVQGPPTLAGLLIVALVCRRRVRGDDPAVNALSRAQERRADRDALAWTQQRARAGAHAAAPERGAHGRRPAVADGRGVLRPPSVRARPHPGGRGVGRAQHESQSNAANRKPEPEADEPGCGLLAAGVVGLLEAVRQFQQRPVAPRPAHELEADRQARPA